MHLSSSLLAPTHTLPLIIIWVLNPEGERLSKRVRAALIWVKNENIIQQNANENIFWISGGINYLFNEETEKFGDPSEEYIFERKLNEITMFIRQHGDQNNQNDLEMEKKTPKRETRLMAHHLQTSVPSG